MNNKYIVQFVLTLSFISSLCMSCGKQRSDLPEIDQNKPQEDIQVPKGEMDRYVLMTYDKTIIPAGPMSGTVIMNSYISYFSHMPQGDQVSNIIPENTIKGYLGQNGAGLLKVDNQLYRRSNSATSATNPFFHENTPVRLEIPYRGLIRDVVYQDLNSPGISRYSKNFTISDGVGYLMKKAEREGDLKVHFFDPIRMTALSPMTVFFKRDQLKSILNEVTSLAPELAYIEFPYVYMGMNFCEVHNGKLIMDIEFYNQDEINISHDLFLIAIDTEPMGEWKAVSVVKDAGHIGHSSESLQNCHDENGDLYFVSRGTDLSGFYRNSKINRIKKDEIVVDSKWSIAIADINNLPFRNVRFNGIYVENNKIITLINNSELTSQARDLDLENIWDYYVIDIDTKEAHKINGLKSCSGFRSGANLISKIDGKCYLRYVRTEDDDPYNGYYEYDFTTNTAKPAFNVTKGGYVVDLKKVVINN